MSKSKFSHVRIVGITGVVPEKCINIDDEIQFYGNDPKRLARNKKILGLGTRYRVGEDETTCDLCEAAGRRLINEMGIDKSTIDALVAYTTTPDHLAPANAYILHGRLGLKEDCTCFDMNGGCTSSVHALLLAHSLIESGVARRVLLLGGDTPSNRNDVRNRQTSILLADSAVATLLEYTDNETSAYFYTGSRGAGWKTLVVPAGGARLPIREDIVSREETSALGDVWHFNDDIMKGMEVFKFTMEIGPKSIHQIREFAGWHEDEIDLYDIHQANKQIVTTICKHAGIPQEKAPTTAFEKYANCSTVSVLTVLLDMGNAYFEAARKVIVCSFGVGLSWGSCALNLHGVYNGGISVFHKTPRMSRAEKIANWVAYFKDMTGSN